MGNAKSGLQFRAIIVQVEKVNRNMAILARHIRCSSRQRDNLPIILGDEIFLKDAPNYTSCAGH